MRRPGACGAVAIKQQHAEVSSGVCIGTSLQSSRLRKRCSSVRLHTNAARLPGDAKHVRYRRSAEIDYNIAVIRVQLQGGI